MLSRPVRAAIVGAVQREPIGPGQPRCRRRRPERALLRWPIGRETGAVTSPGLSSVFASLRFPREVISVAVRWYLRCGLSCRDAGKLLAERGVTVGHLTIHRWAQRFTPKFIKAARPCRHAPGNRWFAEETPGRSPVGGPICTGRWISMARSSMSCCRPGVTAAAALLHPGDSHRHSARRGHDRPRARLPAGPRRADPLGVHTVGRYASNPAEADHGRLKARLRPMRGLKRHRSARILAAGHPQCRIGAAATTTLPPASPAATCSASHSTISRSSSDQQRYQMIML